MNDFKENNSRRSAARLFAFVGQISQRWVPVEPDSHTVTVHGGLSTCPLAAPILTLIAMSLWLLLIVLTMLDLYYNINLVYYYSTFESWYIYIPVFF